MNQNQNSVDATVIIPTYNESQNIPVLLESLGTVLSSLNYEIIVVDDNSPDRTWEVAEKVATSNPAIRVIRRIHDRGLSTAVVAGMETARGNVLVVMDADLQHDEAIIPDMVKAVTEGGNDIAVGSRGVSGGSYGEWSKKRRFISWVAATMAHMVLPVRVKDPMSGFFAVKKEFFRDTANRLNPRGFKILLEFIGRNKNPKVVEVGYTFRNRMHGETKLSGSVIRNYLVALLDLKFGKVISSTFIMYGFVGITGVFVNLVGFALGEWLGLPRVRTGLSDHLDPLYLSVPFGIQLSIITNYIGNNYITFYEMRHKGRGLLLGILAFELVSLFGLVVQTGVFQLLQVNGFLGEILDESFRKYINNGLGIIVATVSNYYLNANVTWKSR